MSALYPMDQTVIHPSQYPLAWTLGGNDISASNSRVDTGLQQGNLSRDYGRSLTGLTNKYEASGTARGGMAGIAGQQLTSDYQQQSADLDRTMNRNLADLRRSSVMASTGIMV